MVRWANKINIFILLLLLSSNILSAYEVYIYGFQVYSVDSSSNKTEIVDQDKVNEITSILYNKISAVSEKELVYKILNSNENNPVSEYVNVIKSNLDALAVCTFLDIEYVLFGELLIYPDKSEYSTFIQVYGKPENDIIYDIQYSKKANSIDNFFTETSNIVNQQLYEKITGKKWKIVEKILTRMDEINKNTNLKNAELKETEGDLSLEEKKENEYLDKLIQVLEESDIIRTEEGEILLGSSTGPVKKLLSVYASIGYFFTLAGEWKDVLINCVVLEEGIKLDFVFVNSKDFDFILRNGFLFLYSFAIQSQESTYIYYIHYHELTAKISFELLFEFGDFFGFLIGVGPQYRFDIIDHAKHMGEFNTDIPFGLGLFCNLGFEFLTGKKKEIGIGINNIFDFTLFQETKINYRIFLYSLFKI